MFVLKSVFTAVCSVVAMFGLTKIMGNKQVSQLSMFDYINGITIGSIAADLAIEDDIKNFIVILVAMIVYAFFSIAFSFVTIKSVRLRHLLSGKSMIIIEKGEFVMANMKKCKLDTSEVLTLARNAGYFNIAEINYAIMEDNGTLSFKPKGWATPVTCGDMSVPKKDEGLVCNVILDGKLMPQNLRHSGKNKQWLDSQLLMQGYKNYSTIMLATIDSDYALSVYTRGNGDDMTNVYD